MKKKKILRICIIIIGVWIAFTVGKGFYWYYKFNGENVCIIISSQHSQTPVDIKIYIDDRLMYKDENYLSFYQSVDVILPFGVHKLKTVIDNKEYVRTFMLFPIKFIYIEVSKDQGWFDKSGEASVTIDVSSSPINMM